MIGLVHQQADTGRRIPNMKKEENQCLNTRGEVGSESEQSVEQRPFHHLEFRNPSSDFSQFATQDPGLSEGESS